MARLSLYLLGSPRIERDGTPTSVDRHKSLALLAYLATTGEPCRRDILIDLLWPEADSARGHGNLRSTLFALKASLGDDWLDVGRDDLALSARADVWSDVAEFRSQLARRRRHGHPAAEVCPACLPHLAAAVAAYRGDFLSGFSLKDSADFDDWQFMQAEALRRELGDALDMLVQGHSAQGRFEPAIAYACRWLTLDPLHEPAHAHLMRLYAWCGRRAAALRQYQEARALLNDQLGVAPQQWLTDLGAAIQAGRTPPLPPPQPGRVMSDFLDSGEAVAPSLAQIDEKRVVTILAIRVDPASASAAGDAARLRQVIDDAEAILAQYDGSLLRVDESQILAAFGARRTRESDPELALRAALALRETAARHDLPVRIGVATGEVYSRRRDDGNAQVGDLEGRPLDLAARLATRAQPGQILADESTYRACRRAFAFTPQAEAAMASGDASPYRVENLLPRPAKARGIEGLRAALTGRDEELARLTAALALVRSGQGQIVTLIGEAGVGKSRLVAEIREHDLADGAALRWLEGRCLELGAASSYLPFQDILRGFFGWMEQDDGQRGQDIAGFLHDMVQLGYLSSERAAEIGPLLRRLLSVSLSVEEDRALNDLPPETLRFRTFLALRDVLHALARQRPLALVFEDLHWADALSLDLLSLLMDSLPEAPLLLLCVYRPGREYASRRLAELADNKCRGCHSELHLRELTQQQSSQMAASLLASASLLPTVHSLIVDRAQGNPFFIEETVRSLIDAGVVYREGDFWRAREGSAAAPVPDSVQSVILSRVDHLDRAAKSVLQTAAVIGPIFRRRVLEEATQHRAGLAQALDALEERALIYQERAVPDVQYSFKHVLTQQAVYDSILSGARRDLHGRIAAALETLHRDNLDEHCEELAHHAEQSGDLDAALAYLTMSGEKAKRQFANEAAVAHLTRALNVLKALPASPQRARKELDLLIAVGIPVAASKGMSSQDMLGVYNRAHELCLRLGDSQHLFSALFGLFRFHHTRGHWLKANELSAHMMRLAQIDRTPDSLLDAYRDMGIALFYTPDLAACLSNMEQGLTLYTSLNYQVNYSSSLHDPVVSYLAYSAWVLWLLGHPDQALERCWRLLGAARSLSNPADLAYALYGTGLLHLWRGEIQLAEEQGSEAIRIAAARGYPMWQTFGAVLEGAALAMRGETEHGLGMLTQALGQFQNAGTTLMRTLYLSWLAGAHGQAGRAAQGLRVLDEAFAIVANGGERTFEAELHRVKGELLLQQGAHAGEVERCFQRALETARSQGAKAWELRAATSLARLWQTQGKRDDARILLQGVYGSFSEGFETADLKDASALLTGIR